MLVLDADEPPVLLGEDRGPNPVEYALSALSACMTTALVYHAAAKGYELEEVESRWEGDLNLKGFLGIDPKAWASEGLVDLLMLSAWGFVIVIASLLFLYIGLKLDAWLGTEPNFMLGLFFLAIVTSVGRLYQEAWLKRKKV